MAELIKQLNEDHPDQEPIKIVQVKEKFGGLCFYVENRTEEVRLAIQAAEKVCSRSCQYCGEPAELRRGLYLVTRCDTCENMLDELTWGGVKVEKPDPLDLRIEATIQRFLASLPPIDKS